MSIARPRLTRSAGIGLTAGLALGSIFLAVRAVIFSVPDCEGLLTEDCALQRDIATNLARLHAMFAGGLALVALGLYLSMRKKPGES